MKAKVEINRNFLRILNITCRYRNMEDLPEFYPSMSLRLSRALSDIGVNSWMVKRRRRTFLMLEVGRTIGEKQEGRDVTTFHFGSQSEGTTTPGLNSDVDELVCFNKINIMASWSEWKFGRINYLMVSHGAECVLISKQFLKDHLTKDIANRLRTKMENQPEYRTMTPRLSRALGDIGVIN
ncbi:hypothetical protein MAR_001898 [Mya arenaria]|uniref:Uncharacterized protein n=1 Tax=Mya arenaria TaxID=6604 RepID=A0ABY7FD01_MYAAR|nr:hypothetical protein MAR_001898 [Mya arenaria]